MSSKLSKALVISVGEAANVVAFRSTADVPGGPPNDICELQGSRYGTAVRVRSFPSPPS
jgi:hypothetical protein